MATVDAGRRRESDPADSTISLPVADSDDSRLAIALEEYVALVQDGNLPAQSAFLERHASIAQDLKACLDGLGLVQELAPEFGPGPTGRRLLGGEAPATLGDFRLIRELGRGGMGVVYEAEQMTLGRRVALKVLPTAASLDPRQRQRFQVEAQAAALLHHEHIVPVYAIGLDQGAHFYAMQLIEGQSLADEIRTLREEGPVPRGPHSSGHASTARQRARDVCRLALQAAEALEHAHELGVIHRDIKPSNLLLDGRGKLWVADFGLARLPQDERDLTRTGDMVGTLRYMSPEQVRAETGAASRRRPTSTRWA